jgi:hypothetical protein
MHRSVFPLCKELLRLLPKPLYTSSCDNVESLSTFLNGQKTWKSHCSQSGLYAGCLTTSRCMALSCSWTLDHMGSDTVMQQDGGVSEFTWMIVLYVGVQLLKSLRLMVCTDCVITWFGIQKKGFLYQQMLVIRMSSIGLKQGVSISCLLIFFSEQNGDTVFHCPSSMSLSV